MDNSNRFRVLVLLATVLPGIVPGTVGAHERIKRGFGEYNLFGNSRQLAFDEINRNQNIALWSAQSAVTSSIGQEYGNQLASLARSTHEFTIPVTIKKEFKKEPCQKHNHKNQDIQREESKNQHDHTSYPLRGGSENHDEGQRAVRIPEKNKRSQKRTSKTRWTGIRSRAYRKDQRRPRHPKNPHRTQNGKVQKN